MGKEFDIVSGPSKGGGSASTDGADHGTSKAEKITGIEGDPYLGKGSFGDYVGTTGGEGDKVGCGAGSRGPSVRE